MSTRSDLRRTAADTFGWTQLRPEQLEAMEHATEGRDVLAVLPTGSGKSAICQVPALLHDGPTVVVSPLVALQHDQREGEPGLVYCATRKDTTVRHPQWGEGVVMSTERDRVTVLFAGHGYKTLALDAVREHDLLKPAD